jgi:lipid II:glycine glycyltransferase (peptidoglycan interpeptide bridge formation enzyme)
MGRRYGVSKIPVRASGVSNIYALHQEVRFWRRYYYLAPFGLCVSPGRGDAIEAAAVREVLDFLQVLSTTGFTWNVRFDHQSLADQLLAAGLRMSRSSTHVLRLGDDYSVVFGGYNHTRRNEVRRAAKAGIVVQRARTVAEVDEYYSIHNALAVSKRFRTTYPVQFFRDLIEDRESVHLLLARLEERTIGGGVFFRDGNSVVYWHGAADRNYSAAFPTCAILDSAIRWACSLGATFFNFGGSIGIESLESFKSSWGTTREWNWTFEWRNPTWANLSKLKRNVTRRNG